MGRSMSSSVVRTFRMPYLLISETGTPHDCDVWNKLLAQPETIGRLALGIVHDFNNALTLLRGQLSLVEHLLDGQATARVPLGNLMKSFDYVCQLPRQLLGFIRNEPPPQQRVDVNTLLTSMEGLLQSHLLGATLERRGWLSNDAVNAFSTLAAALFAAWAVVVIGSRW